MAEFLDICRFIPTAGGTTDWTFAVAATGYQGLAAAGAVNGTVYRYRAESSDLSQWEIGYGTYNASTGVVARSSVLFNSSGTTSKINFSAVPQVAIVALAEDLPSLTKASNTFTGVMAVGDGTASTSTTSGALKVSGGLGVTGSVFIGGSLSAFTQTTVSATSDTSPARLIFNGQIGRRNWQVGNQININDGFEITPSTVNGGSTFSIPAVKILGADSSVVLTSTSASTSPTSGALTVAGGMGVAGQVSQGSKTYFTLNPASIGVQIDTSGQTGVTVANGSNAPILPAGQQFAWLFIQETSTSGDMALYALQYTGTFLVWGTTAWAATATTTPAAGKLSVCYDGSIYRIYNNIGGARVFNGTFIRN
jgi:hypothetical protein